MKYFEGPEAAKDIRDEQYRQLEAYLDSLLVQSAGRREAYFQPDFTSIDEYVHSSERYRTELLKSIGYLESEGGMPFLKKEIYVGEDDICRIYRLFIHVAEGLECYGILMVPANACGKLPLMLSFHGGGGCPEMICGMNETANYHEGSYRLVREGYVVFSPLFVFRPFIDHDNTEIPVNVRSILDVRAKWTGTSLVAIELLKLRGSLDYLLTRPEVDANRAGVCGLSYGGFYALLVAAADKRMKACISSCYFNDREKINKLHPESFHDWVWTGTARKFTDAEIVGLICPRHCFIEVGIGDELFPLAGAREELVKASSYYKRLGIEERISYIEFDGGHEFNLDCALRHLQNLWRSL